MSRKYFLYEGQFMITNTPTEIITVLGSCVAVCLWDPSTKLGAMNHYLLPGAEGDASGNPSRGYSATRMLIRSMLNRGSQIDHIEAKIFGGCSSIEQPPNGLAIGRRNADIAIQSLSEVGIRIVANQTGGRFGRKIVFNTRTGKVLMRLLTKSATDIFEEINKGFGY